MALAGAALAQPPQDGSLLLALAAPQPRPQRSKISSRWELGQLHRRQYVGAAAASAFNCQLEAEAEKIARCPNVLCGHARS